MIKTKRTKVTTKVEKIERVICDRCNKEWTYDDIIEWQESYRIQFTGGYGSLFGDESKVTCDLCQGCLYDLIKIFCFVDGERFFVPMDEKEGEKADEMD